MNTEGIDVAFYWSAKEAATILDYLDRLRDLIWEYYAEDIKELRYREVLAGVTGESGQICTLSLKYKSEINHLHCVANY